MKIRIKPEQVMEVAKQFQQAQQQAQTLASGLRKSIYNLESQWNGVTREKFFQSFQQSNKIIEQYSRTLHEVEGTLKEIIRKFSKAVALLPVGVVENIADFIRQPVNESKKQLKQYGFSDDKSAAFLHDLQHVQYVYSIMKLEVTDAQTLKADHGFMILESSRHQWILCQQDDKASFLVSRLSKELLQDQIEKLAIHNFKGVCHD
ncbi:MAG: WXG100 family type VII secretion target [Ectobacillus sp.]